MSSLLDPTILFFILGLAAGVLRSNLDIPQAVSRFLSLYLLMALGLKGGFALAKSGFSAEVVASLACAVVLAVAIPLAGYWLLRRVLGVLDAAAVAATYGSVSAVTFITAVQYLETRGLPAGGHMAAAMALMESPAIILAVLMANWHRSREAAPAQAVIVGGGAAALRGGPPPQTLSVGRVLHESFTDGAQLLLLGAMVVGYVSGPAGQAAMQPFTGDLFKGLLAFFLLDMGLQAARNLASLRGCSPLLAVYALLAPMVHALVALLLAAAVGLSVGNAALLAVLAASASYIAVPAVLRHALPEVSPSLYFGMSLGLTFPFNILAGIPLYTAMAQAIAG